jgi:hypothetical protein
MRMTLENQLANASADGGIGWKDRGVSKKDDGRRTDAVSQLGTCGRDL